MIHFWQGLHTGCPHCASNMVVWSSFDLCDERSDPTCKIIRQLTDQLQERNKDLSQLELKLGDLKNQVRQLEGHLERERQEQQTLYYKNEASHER